MSDTPDPAAEWEAQLADVAEDPTPVRRNAFDAARKKTFLKALAKGATLNEAAKIACVGKSTIYEHQKEDPNFAAACLAARKVIAPVVELAAFDRAVTGVEEDVISYGKHVGTRVKRSDALLQTLLKGSNPDKYGSQAGTAKAVAVKALRKKWREKERKRLRKEIEAELEAEQEKAHNLSEEEIEEMRARILRRIQRLREREYIPEQVAKGFTYYKEFDLLIPPGWTMVPTGQSGHSGHSGNVDDGHPECPESLEGPERPEAELAVPFSAPTR